MKNVATSNLNCLAWLIIAAALALVAPSPARAQAKPAADPDASCLTCHGQKDLQSAAGRSVYVDPAQHKSSVHADLPCTGCHADISDFPHPAHVARVLCSSCHAEEAAALPKSAHAALGDGACTACHGSAHNAQPAEKVAPRQCTTCHADEVKNFLASVHGASVQDGRGAHGPDAPSCQSCHGPAHTILPSDDPASRVAKKNLPDTCGGCHANADFIARHQIPFAHPVEAYKQSVHGQAVAAGNQAAASCSDCHGSHGIFRASDPRSKINHASVPATCGACHSEIQKTYAASIHGQAAARGLRDAPVCTDCHGKHNILAPQDAQSLVNPARVSTDTCGRCHGDARLNARYNLPADRVPTFADSYHGLAARAGGQTVANCASCHGVHNIFPSSDPRSTVNAANLARTCGACHPGAGEHFAIGAVHVQGYGAAEHPLVKWIRRFYWVLIPLTLGFMFLHQLLDFLRKLIRGSAGAISPDHSSETVERMNLHFRIAHWLTVLSFPVLVITGFALKFPEAWWARPILVWENHFAFRGTVHRIAAVILLASLAYHFVHLALVRRDRAVLGAMIPRVKDARDMVGMLLFNLGLSDREPHFGKFSYVEKMEYLAFIWGSAVMALTGFILWFDNFVLRHFPKWVTDAATALHYYEAILATFSILIWHMYTVVFDPDIYPMDKSWLTGKASAEHLSRTRPAYYAALVRDQQPPAAPAPATDETPAPEEKPKEESDSPPWPPR